VQGLDEGFLITKVTGGVAFVHRHEVMTTGAVWKLTVDFDVRKYARAVRDIRRDVDELILRCNRDEATRRELSYLQKMIEEIEGRMADVEQMLPRTDRRERNLISVGGQVLRFLFGTALDKDIRRVNEEMD
jgi:hypothetical protein